MPSTHLSLHVHIIFATKDRIPMIAPEWRERLHAYLGGTAKNAGAVPEAIGGTADHVHLLIGLPSTLALAAVVREIKAVSSRWIHEELRIDKFAWQEGYGAFTVSPTHCGHVRDYIARQEEHHRVRTFQEEYVSFLKRYSVTYEERFLW
jgi:REP element-mobilizing transposase RayT